MIMKTEFLFLFFFCMVAITLAAGDDPMDVIRERYNRKLSRNDRYGGDDEVRLFCLDMFFCFLIDDHLQSLNLTPNGIYTLFLGYPQED